MKAIALFLLIVLFIFLAGGYYLAFMFTINNHKNKMLSDIHKAGVAEEIQTFTLSFADYKKYHVEKHELLINGKMYDIISLKIANNRVVVTCFEDVKESKMLASFTDMNLVSLPGKQNNLPQVLIRFYTQIFYESPVNYAAYLLNLIPLINSKIYFPSSCISECPTPPPPEVHC